MAPKLLILETSGKAGAVALAEGDAVRQVRRLDETRRHARDLAPAVGQLLAAEGWHPLQLAAVIVSRGPGSYTGLRVGIMSAKAFAYATGCALIAVDTFAAIAVQAPAEVLLLDVLADAQQDKVYVQRFGRSAAGAIPTACATLAIEAFSTWLSIRDPSAWVSGPALPKVCEQLPAGARMVTPEDWDPRPESLLRLGLPRLLAGERDDVWSLEPLYLRPSSAEEKWTALGR
jgi:tRNA threonylcarbamoyladenosine biosynthesis protein TsaB